MMSGKISIPEWQVMEILGTEHERVFQIEDHDEVRAYLDRHGLHYHEVDEHEDTAARIRRLFGGA